MSKRECKIGDCTGPVRAWGWCNKHYRRWARWGDPLKAAWERGDPEANFWAKVQREGDHACWHWKGFLDDSGYGRFVWPGGQLAHRFAYETFVGPIPEGMDVDHACHTRDPNCDLGVECPHRRCVNPSHLSPETPADNRGTLAHAGKRAEHLAEIQRAKTNCPSGHPYDATNTYVDKRGSRNCRACRRPS